VTDALQSNASGETNGRTQVTQTPALPPPTHPPPFIATDRPTDRPTAVFVCSYSLSPCTARLPPQRLSGTTHSKLSRLAREREIDVMNCLLSERRGVRGRQLQQQRTKLRYSHCPFQLNLMSPKSVNMILHSLSFRHFEIHLPNVR
jgi:hypothetical protein